MMVNVFSLISKALDVAVTKYDSKDAINSKLYGIYAQFKSRVNDLPVAQLNYLYDQMKASCDRTKCLYSKSGSLDDLKTADVYQKFQKIISAKLESLKEYEKEYEI